MKLYVSIRGIIKNDIQNFIFNNRNYKVSGNVIICSSMESKLLLMRFITFHDPSKMLNEYVCIKYLKGEVTYTVIIQNPYYELKKENWSKSLFLASDINIELNKFNIVDDNELIKFKSIDIDDYFEKGILKDMYYFELRDNPSFIAALLSRGFFVRKTDEDGSLMIYE